MTVEKVNSEGHANTSSKDEESNEIPFKEDSNEKASKEKNLQIDSYFAPGFLLFWLLLIVAIIVPTYLKLPAGNNIANEHALPGQFIAERAQKALSNFDLIGPKTVGSNANENVTVKFLFNEIKKIREVMHQDLYDLDVDRQIVSGAYIHWSMVNMYQGVQNVVVRFKPKKSNNQSYLLLNAHFDSKPSSPGAGDDGAMVVIMLEVLRVLATSRKTFAHPIVFLFNGAEENPLQASHGFVTQHKWAKNCKAVINLDSAGSGNREILFQSGPRNPWLMNYYYKYAKRPFANTFSEELFQSNLIPSDTDFRIFRDWGRIPGLDFAHNYNGYVYHTKYDRSNVIPRGTLQATGDNVLSLVRAFSNSTILENPKPYANGTAIFYDYLGLFLIFYTAEQGQVANNRVSLATVVLVVISLWFMASSSRKSFGHTFGIFVKIFLLQLVGWVLAVGLPLLLAFVFDMINNTLTYYTHKWFVYGLFVCPTLIGLSLPNSLYLSLSREKEVSLPLRVQMVLHAHSLLMAILCVALTYLGIRSSYFCLISQLFYGISLIFNLITTLYRRAFHWSLIVILSQIIPFLYFAYLFNALVNIIIPMLGRFGTTSNPDLYAALLTLLGALLSMGYLIPLINIFRRPKFVLFTLFGITIAFVIMSLTSVGFPYRAETQSERVNFIEVRRIFYEYDGSVSRNESGYYFDFQDRRKHLPIKPYVDVTGLQYLGDDCKVNMMCGVPVFNHRMQKSRAAGAWLPRQKPLQLPGTPKLTLLQKIVDDETKTVRFEFKLQGPPHMGIFIQPVADATVTDWSFIKNMLKDPTWKLPYFIYFSYGSDNTPLSFYITLEKEDGTFDTPIMQLGIGGHYVNREYKRDAESEKFIQSFPDFSAIMEWPASYERYIF